MTVFIALTSITIVLSSVLSHPQWFLQLAPYLAIAIVYYGKVTKELLLFETAGALALLGYNFFMYYWVYDAVNAANMLLYKLIGSPVLPDSKTLTMKAFSPIEVYRLADGELLRKTVLSLQSVLGAVYTACMLIIIFRLCRRENVSPESGINLRSFALSRMCINMAACYVPLMLFLKAVLFS